MTQLSAILNRLDPILRAWNGLPRWARLGTTAGFWLSLAGLIFLAGFQVAYREIGPYTLIQRIDNKLTEPFRSAAIPPLEGRTFTTTLLSLRSEVGIVPTGLGPRNGRRLYEQGGGLTSLGDHVLLLPYTGQVFAATSASDIRATDIQAPENGRIAYLAAAADAGPEYNFHLGYMRYNDILHVQRSDGRHALLASYSEFHGDRQCTTNTIAMVELPAGSRDPFALSIGADDWTILYRTQPCLPLKTKHFAVEAQMASGKLAFDGDATLYLTSGDYHFDGMRTEGEAIAQDPDADYGKVIAIDLDSGAARRVSMGHRNMQGIAFGADGALYVTEHGPRGGDELNRIIPGANYGWPNVSLGTAYSATPLNTTSELGRHDGFEYPVAAWVPSVAVSALAPVSGFHPAWEGDFLAGSLNNRALFHIRMREDRVVYIERIELGGRVRALLQHSDGRIIAWTDNQELIFFTAEDLASPAEQIPDWLATADLPARVKASFETVMARCTECHALIEGDDTGAPSLARVYDNDIASTGYGAYSDALKNRSGRWTRENLTAFLLDPQGFAPGTVMPAAEGLDPETADAIALYLRHLDQQF